MSEDTNTIPDGYYTGRAVAAQLGETSTGKEQICVEFVITQGEHEGKRLPWYGYFTDAALNITFEGLRAAGFKGHNLEDLSSLEPSEEEASLKVSTTEYDGKTRTRVDFVNPLGGGYIRNPMDAKKKSKFAAKYSKLWQKLEKSTQTKAKAEETAEDDVPFDV